MQTSFRFGKGPVLTLVPESKFKTVLVSYKFSCPFRADRLNDRALMPQVLMAASKAYPDKQAVQSKLDDLYGTRLYSTTNLVGSTSVISFDLAILADAFTWEKDSSLLLNATAFLDSLLLQPRLRNGAFLKHVVDEEVRLLEEELDGLLHDKQAYSFHLFKQTMFEGENYRLNVRGDWEGLNRVTPQTMMEAYQSMLQDDDFEIVITGNFDPELVAQWFQTRTPDVPTPDLDWIDQETTSRTAPIIHQEMGEVVQSRVTIGYRTRVHAGDELERAMSLFSILLGETDQSRLFQTVREQNGMSYAVSSSYSAGKGVLFLFAGVAQGEEERVVSLMQTTLTRLFQEEISDEDLHLAKEHYISRLRKTHDSLSGIAAKAFYAKKIYGDILPLETSIHEVRQVTKEQIQQAGATLVLDTVHIYAQGVK